MSQNIEIEFKNLLTKDEFTSLMINFQVVTTDFIKQENHYFDTPDFLLKQKHCALRIREKNNIFELTLKQPYGEDLLETNEHLSTLQAQEIFRTGILPNGPIVEELKKLMINPEQILYFGALITDRVELKYGSGLLVLDHSYYLNHEDYELEYEVEERALGLTEFTALLNEHNIPLRKTDNKIMRFYQAKYKQT